MDGQRRPPRIQGSTPRIRRRSFVVARHTEGVSTRYRMRYSLDHEEYFPALRNIHSLMLLKTRVEHTPNDLFLTCFSAFRGTLTHLSLDAFATPFSAFLTLVGYFSNIRSL